MKKIISALIFLLLISSITNLEAIAAPKNSPTKDYKVFLDRTKNSIPYYSNPGGKKKGEIPDVFAVGYGFRNAIVVKKVVSDYYTKAEFYDNPYAPAKIGYIKNSDLNANELYFEYAIVRVNTLNLRSQPTTKSKVLAKIKRGTQVKVSQKWSAKKGYYKATYYKNGKKYVGYLDPKYLFKD